MDNLNTELPKPEPINEEIRSITTAISSLAHEEPGTTSLNQATELFLQRTDKVLASQLGVKLSSGTARA